MKTFDDVDVSKLSENEYILFQISKTKRFDYELVAEEAARQAMIEGIEKGRLKGIEESRLEGIEEGRLEGIEEELAKIVLRLLDKEFTLRVLRKEFTPLQVSELLDFPFERIEKIIDKYLPKDSE